jgi:hypothetical protein
LPHEQGISSTTRLRGTRRAQDASRAAVRCRQDHARGDRPASRRQPHQRPSLVLEVARRGKKGAAQGGSGGPQASSLTRAASRNRHGSATRAGGPRLFDRPMDAAAGGAVDRGSDGSALPLGACVADPASFGLDAPAPGPSGQGEKRQGDPPLDGGGVAAGKKTPAASAPGSFSRTRAAFRSDRRSDGRGRRGARRRW